MATKRLPACIPVLSVVPRLIENLQLVLPDVEFASIPVGEVSGSALKQLQEAEVVIADNNLVAPHIYNLMARWVQGTWAGVEPLIKAVRERQRMPSCQITRFTGQHFGRLMSEYIVANIFNWERAIRGVMECQSNCVWRKEHMISEYRSICDLTFGIVGLGAIGKHVSETLKFFGGTVWAVVRNVPEPNQRCPHVDKYSPFSELSDALQNSDYVISILPATSGTNGLFAGDVLKSCSKKKSVFMNVGRGNVISEGDIIAAIDNKWISGAILDVFEVEPLPTESKLWKRPEVVITPHISASTRAKEVAETFKENLGLYLCGESLLNVVDFQKGY